MKKSIFIALLVSTFSYSYAAVSCLDLSTNLSRGAESSVVLSLQNFLYAKGLLKVAPNGYFGPSTFAAVKAYQKGIGLAQVGNTGPATRAAIKKESCQSQANSVLPQTGASSTATVQSSPIVNASTATSFVRPLLDHIEYVSLFAGGTTDWGFSLYGSNFSTSSNTVLFRNTGTHVSYTIGTFSSATGTAVVLPANLTGTSFSCGTNCMEKLPAGQYEVVVRNEGGESDSKLITIQPFTLTIQNLASQTLPASQTGNKIALVSFSTPAAVTVKTVSFDVGTSTISGGGLSVSPLHDEINGGDFKVNSVLNPLQTALISVYADTNNTTPGTLYGTCTVGIEDFIGKHTTTFTSQPILMTVNGVL